MRSSHLFLSLHRIFLAFLVASLTLLAGETGRAAERAAWTASRIHGTPEPPAPYKLERAYPKLKFSEPLGAVNFPGTDHMVVVERWGKLWSIPSDESCETPELFADLKKFDPEVSESYGIAFHPNFAQNRLAYVFLMLDSKGKGNRQDGSHVVRFRVTSENPPTLDLASGTTIFTWMSGGHNGGNIAFGPDGMLYFSTGDTAAPDPPDPLGTGQNIGDALSSVLRLDVDHSEAGKEYGIPKDNPFVTTPNARGEVWAYGFRNPYRMSFDLKTGDLWVGDVGWELWESVDLVKRGGNYGWSVTEAGMQDIHPNGPHGPTPILPPVVVHSHEEAASMTGGEVYYGNKLPELYGAYIYGDWQFGTFWALWQKDGKLVGHEQLCHTTIMPAGFGIMPNSELLVGDQGGGGLYWLVHNPDAGKPSQFPVRLSETGLFTDAVKQTPEAGVFPYQVNAQRFADFATSERWVAMPGGDNTHIAKKEQGVMAADRWEFPAETAFAKTYSIDMEKGNPASRRKLETQVLHFDGHEWSAYSYRWNEAQTDAELVGPRGTETDLQIKDSQAPGGVRVQKWRYFSRTECLRCHNLWNNFAPGFAAWQLNRHTASGEDQIALFSRLGLTPDHVHQEIDPPGENPSLETRARSYLQANCSVCHRNGGGGSVPSFMTIETPLREARIVDSKPAQGDLGLDDGRVIAPGAPTSSVLLYRLTTAGRGHMPYLGGRLVNDQGILLLRDWIASLPPAQNTPPEATQRREALIKSVTALAEGDTQQIAHLLESRSGALALALAVIDGSLKGELREQAIATGAANADPLRRDLFERMLPPEKRRKTLGTDLKPDALLAMQGEAARGQAQFAAICAACHRAGEAGVDYAPDLTHVSTRLERSKIIERILQPSKNIEPQWELATVATSDGETFTGFIGAKTDRSVTLRLPGGASKTLAQDKIKSLTTAKVAVMPEGLLQNFTEQEAGDLLAFLWSLK